MGYVYSTEFLNKSFNISGESVRALQSVVIVCVILYHSSFRHSYTTLNATTEVPTSHHTETIIAIFFHLSQRLHFIYPFFLIHMYTCHCHR